MSNYTDLKKEELVEEAKNRSLSGYSDKNKDELVGLLEEHDASQGSADTSLDNPEVVAELSPSGQEAAAELPEALKEEAAVELDAAGPLHLQSPSERYLTGAVNEDDAEEQRKRVDLGDGHAGHVLEDGTPVSGGEQSVAKSKGEKKDNLGEGDDRDVYEVRPEHVIDFPPPVGLREGTTERTSDRTTDTQERNPELAYADPNGALGNPVIGGGSRSGDVYAQKSVLYTDGLSGGADHNLERAYEIPELLQSNSPVEREAGDESLSEAAKAEKTDRENKIADYVKSRDDDPASRAALNKPQQ